MNRFVTWMSATVALVLTALPLAAQTDTEFSYQGSLNDQGVPANGVYSLVFYLYDAPTNGNLIGSVFNNSSLTVTDGLFTAELDFGADAFDNTGRWLEIHVNSSLLAPRQPITRSPYSIQTRGIFVDEDNNVGIGTTTPADPLHVSGEFPTVRIDDDSDPSSYSEITDGGSGQLRIDKTNESGLVYVDLNPKPGDGTSDATVRFFRDTNTTGDKAVQFLRGNSSSEISAQIGVDGEHSFFQTNGGRFGIGTSSPSAKLHVESTGAGVGIRSVIYGGSRAIEGWYLNPAPYGSGVLGTTSSADSYGIEGQVTGADSYGVFGRALGDATRGVYGSSAHTSGYGVYGENYTSTGVTYGVFGRAASSTGRGTYGLAEHTTGINYGVVGRSNSPNGYDFYASGAGTNYGASSSRRWKNNIVNINNPLDKLAALRGVYFDWDEEHGGQHDVGMIAEEVGAVMPEIVNYEENSIDAIGMDYSKMTPLLVEAVNALRGEKDAEIQSLRAENDAARVNIRTLQYQNEELRARLRAIEAHLNLSSTIERESP